MNAITETLKERGNRYGPFTSHAEITQDLKKVMVETLQWEELSPDKKEALDMIMHKVGRILNGDPNYADSWHDIGGYAKLVEDNLQSEKLGSEETKSPEITPRTPYKLITGEWCIGVNDRRYGLRIDEDGEGNPVPVWASKGRAS
jgi:hypothetical protein